MKKGLGIYEDKWNKWKKTERRLRIVGCLLLIGQLALLAMLLSMLSGCTTTRYVPEYRDRVVTRHDTVRDSVVRRDYVWRHDSMDVKRRGDTVMMDRWHTVQVVRYVREKGERMSDKSDSASVEKAAEKTVEKKATGWGKVRGKINLFAALFVALALVTLWLLYGIIVKHNK